MKKNSDDEDVTDRAADDSEFICTGLNTAHKEWSLINFNRIEFIAINTDQEFNIDIEESVTIKQDKIFTNLGVSLNKKRLN